MVSIPADRSRMDAGNAFDLTSLAAATEQTTDCLVITNTSAVVHYANPEFTALTGYNFEEAVGQNPQLHQSGTQPPEVHRDLWRRLRAGRRRGELTSQRKDGMLYREAMQIMPVPDGTGEIPHYIALERDVTAQRRQQDENRRALQFAQATIDALSSQICVLNGVGSVLTVNRAWRDFACDNAAGAPTKGDQAWVGTNYLEVCGSARGEDAESATAFGAGVRAVLAGECEQYTAEYPCNSPTQVRWFMGRVTRFPEESPVRVLVEHIDITQRRLAEEALLFKTALLEAETETTLDGILVVDDADHIVLANRQFALLFKIPEELLKSGNDLPVRQHVTDAVLHPDAFLDKVSYLYRQREARSRDEIALRDGRMLDRYSSPLVDPTGRYRGRIWYFRDITERKLAEAKSEFLAYHDALTGLPQRALLEDRLTTALAGARRRGEMVGLLFIDLDRFKMINDTYGHAAGDAVLQEVAARLRHSHREQDTVARLGGDEFVMMLTGVHGACDVALAAERVLNSLQPGIVLQGKTIHVGCSVGISMYPEHGADGATLMRNADRALYATKGGERGTFRFFTEQMNAQVMEGLTLERELHGALERGELFLEYQPQVHSGTGRMVGLEALVRWQHPTLGLVHPCKFIPVAESCGLILPLGQWALRTACLQAKQWLREEQFAGTIAVNVSAVQIDHGGFVELVRRTLCETGLPAHLLELELTEGILLANAEVISGVLQDLSALGVQLSIDDFGTGYSSFTYLRQFRVNKLKIDQSFVRDVAVDANDAAIVRAIISLARALKLKVMAEGVENEAQMLTLREQGCDEMQGFYFARPMRAEQVRVRLVNEWSERSTLQLQTAPCSALDQVVVA